VGDQGSKLLAVDLRAVSRRHPHRVRREGAGGIREGRAVRSARDGAAAAAVVRGSAAGNHRHARADRRARGEPSRRRSVRRGILVAAGPIGVRSLERGDAVTAHQRNLHRRRRAVAMTHCGGVSAVVRQIRSIALRLVFVPALAGVLFAADATDVHVLPVQGSVFMLVSAGGNITVQIGDEGVLVVDTSVAEASDNVIAAIRGLTDKPIRYIVNTHAHPDHTGGNASIAKAGATIGGGTVGAAMTPSGASILSHENVLTRMSAPTGEQAPTPTDAWPPKTDIGSRTELFFPR